MLRTYFFPRYRFGVTLLRHLALAKGKVNGLAAGKVEKHMIKDVFAGLAPGPCWQPGP
jgi:hypothetical protein